MKSEHKSRKSRFSLSTFFSVFLSSTFPLSSVHRILGLLIIPWFQLLTYSFHKPVPKVYETHDRCFKNIPALLLMFCTANFFIAVTKDLKKRNLRMEGFLLPHSLRTVLHGIEVMQLNHKVTFHLLSDTRKP